MDRVEAATVTAAGESGGPAKPHRRCHQRAGTKSCSSGSRAHQSPWEDQSHMSGHPDGVDPRYQATPKRRSTCDDSRKVEMMRA
ncbi:hypothetical protein Scep_012566 [Stephania cephalantha]|uniref:Uncharacterized protein n=1 Tax=Stephania cephalantha TaxID=152367 RepID=A0AAP0JH33_9MAGN